MYLKSHFSEELTMAESLNTLQGRRQILPYNPYFQGDLVQARDSLGKPSVVLVLRETAATWRLLP